jgi:hypothetical protein
MTSTTQERPRTACDGRGQAQGMEVPLSTMHRKSRRARSALTWRLLGLLVAMVVTGLTLAAVYGSPALVPVALLAVGAAICCDATAARR